jgi:23S rRNA (uracil1939-C5)-methyltransferase
MNTNVKIIKLDNEGRGIAYLKDKICFIPNALPGEEVTIEIVKDNKKFAIGKVTKYITKNDKRIKELCPYYDKCGGCSLEHLSYNDELIYKEQALQEIIKRYANIDLKIKVNKCLNEYNYRDKISLKIVNNNWGYYNEASHKFIKIDKCLLAKKAINKIIQDKNLFNILNGEIIIRTNYNNEILIKINTNGKWDININKLRENNKIVGIVVNNKIIYGENEFIELINGYLFKVNINSFFQVNEEILSKIFDYLGKKNYHNVVDLYCGVGTLGIAIKKDNLYGIEIVPEAVENAVINAKINKQNNYYLLGDSSKINKIEHQIDTIIIDPPRSGLNKETLDNIIKIKAKQIIYMSCDMITLARDLNILKEYYDAIECNLFDMFPRTYHVETIVVLKLKN